MSINLSRSLIFRTGLSMAGITLLAIFTMVSSVIIADTARGDAAAINLAGSLRMQAYRMASHIQNPNHDRATALLARDIRAFDASLHDATLSSVIPTARDNPLAESYGEVIAHWRNRLKPSVERYSDAPGNARQQYLAAVETFVAEVDHMVHQLQQEAEGKIQLLRLIQGIALFLTLALVFFTMYKLLLDVIPPLRDLLAAVDDARQGNLNTRTTYRSQDELGLLSRTFNEMAENLSLMYAELEQRVADRTAELQRSNKSLEVLYETANRLGRSPPNDVMAYRPILELLEQATGLGPVTLCLAHPGQASAFSQIATRDRRPAQCTAPDCASCFEAAMHGRVPIVPDAQVIPIMENDQHFGVLVVERGDREPAPWQRNLIEAVGAHIATSRSLARQAEQHRLLALIEERTVIARELHDSLAQSLSYLKIQVARLQKITGTDTAGAGEIVSELREGLNAAYRQLRELLTTFRLQMNEPGLEPALRKTTREFADRAHIDIALDYGLGNCPLTPNEEIHVLQIVREALANVDHHARARRAEVRLRPEDDGTIRVTVTDDGVGIDDTGIGRQHHYGLRIMEERAQGLNGRIELRRGETGGTTMELRFQPQRSPAPLSEGEDRGDD